MTRIVLAMVFGGVLTLCGFRKSPAPAVQSGITAPPPAEPAQEPEPPTAQVPVTPDTRSQGPRQIALPPELPPLDQGHLPPETYTGPMPPVVESSFRGRRVFSVVHPSHESVLVLFHGKGGGGDGWVKRPEAKRFVEMAVRRGYAIFAADSGIRAPQPMWDTTHPNNPEVADVNALIAHMQDTGKVKADAPVFGLGMSNGAYFLSVHAHQFDYKAIALFCSAGVKRVYYTHADKLPPILFAWAENDTTVPKEKVLTALEIAEEKGAIYKAVHMPPRPLRPDYLTRKVGIDSSLAQRIVAELRRHGIVDTTGRFTRDPADPALDLQRKLAKTFPEAKKVGPDILTQFNILYAEHKFSTDAAPQVFQWFDHYRDR